MAMDLADLHLHTHCSDGALSPEELVRRAYARGLKAIAITDHDTVEGIAPARSEGRRWGIEVVAGVELSVSLGKRSFHLLGYFFDPENAALAGYLDAYRAARRRRGEQIVERLADLGLRLSFDHVLVEAREGVVGRPHIARAMVAGGLVPTYEDAFMHYLGNGRPAHVPMPSLPVAEALAVLHRAGGIGVLAHPGNWTTSADIRAMMDAGLDGIETVHPSHDPVLENYYTAMARDFLLIQTGGSDYHGYREQDETNLGRVAIPYARVERARTRAIAA